MNKINERNNKIYWAYKIGFFIILALPAFIWNPYFFPADWGKSIIFRSILSLLLVLFFYQIFYKKEFIPTTDIKSNKIVLAMGIYFIIFLLATIFSVDKNFSLWGSPFRGGGFVTFGFCFVFGVLSFLFFKKEDWKKAWIFSIFIGIAVSFLALVQHYGFFSSKFIHAEQPPSTMGNPILLAIYLLMLLFPIISFVLIEKNRRLKLFYIFSIILFAFVILISETRAVYLGAVIGILYFLLFFPKQNKLIKYSIALLLISLFSIVLYVNINPQLPKLLENKITKSIASQLSIKKALADERFLAWKIVVKEIKEKPILGWGPENLSIGFDKNYDSKIVWSVWWDRAHNIFLDVAVQAGILGMFAQIGLFFILFWKLQKTKKNIGLQETPNINKQIVLHGIQTTLIGYLVAGFFSLDSLSVYIVLFFIIGYILYLTKQDNLENIKNNNILNKKSWWKPIILSVLFFFLLIFLWQYNFAPLQINADINKATTLAKQKKCTEAFNLMDKNLLKNSFLDSYVRMEYIEIEKICSAFYPENSLIYIKKGIEVLREAVKTQPTYTRYWIDLGELTTNLVWQEDDQTKKLELVSKAESYFQEASQLAPRHQEILTDLAKLSIANGEYKKAINYTQQCVAMNPETGLCYFYLAISQIYNKNLSDYTDSLKMAKDHKFDLDAESNLIEIADAYGSIPDYEKLAETFEKLLTIDRNKKIAQYHSSLAFFYSKLGRYNDARKEALEVLKVSPESKQSVDEFLKTLP